MFIDEMYEDLLINKQEKITTVHIQVTKAKITTFEVPGFIVDLKRIENGYQLFRKRHPEFPENSFRRFCFVRWSKAGQDLERASKYFRFIGWKVDPEFKLIGR